MKQESYIGSLNSVWNGIAVKLTAGLMKFKIIGLKTCALLKIFCIFVCLSSKLMAVDKDKAELDGDNDYIAILYGQKSPSELKNPLLVFDNIELKGRPSIVIDNYTVKDFRSKKEKSKKIDFVVFNHGNGAGLKIEQFENEIAKLSDKGKSYYVHLSPNLFVGDRYPSNSRWRTIKGQEAFKAYNELFERDIKLKESNDTGLGCVKDKDLSCLKIFLKEDYEIYRAANLLWKYENLKCAEVSDYSTFFDHFGGFKWDEKIVIPWLSLENVFSGKIKADEVKIRTRDFGKIYRIEIGTKDKEYCSGKVRMSVQIDFENKNYASKENNVWEVLFNSFREKYEL